MLRIVVLGAGGRRRCSAMELRMSGLPGSASENPELQQHPGLDRVQRATARTGS